MHGHGRQIRWFDKVMVMLADISDGDIGNHMGPGLWLQVALPMVLHRFLRADDIASRLSGSVEM